MNIEELNKQYEYICNEWIKKFCKKQEIEFDGFVGNEIGGVASFNEEYFFEMSDIILDLNTKQPKGLILEWQNSIVENGAFINYKSYTMGLRHKDIQISKTCNCGMQKNKNNLFTCNRTDCDMAKNK